MKNIEVEEPREWSKKNEFEEVEVWTQGVCAI